MTVTRVYYLQKIEDIEFERQARIEKAGENREGSTGEDLLTGPTSISETKDTVG
jgi:hypothetical protein